MRTLEKGAAFNGAYREAWREYYNEITAETRKERLQALTEGLGHECRELCERHAALAPYFFPHPLLEQVFFQESMKAALLPEKTVQSLTRVGFFGQLQSRLDALQIELDLPEEPLPELISHSGLVYVKKQARTMIAGKTVIDGGAYIGDTAKMLVKHYAPKAVLALEPEARSYERMTSLVAHWGLTDIIIPIRAALSGQSGTETLWGEGVGASVIQKHSIAESKCDNVESMSIDDLVDRKNIEAVGLIKLDVEGNEYKSICGAVKTLRRDRPLLLISIYHTAKDFYEIKPMIEALDLGYKFLIRKITDDLIKELVLICLPEEVNHVPL